MTAALRVFISAGEASADHLGAALLKALRRTREVEAAGMGGPAMEAEGFQCWRSSRELSVVGLVEVLGQLPRLLRLNADLARRAAAYRPDVAVLIDAPDFHVRLAHALRGRMPVAHYVPPQVWASRPGRAARFAAAFDRILYLFPFEGRYWPAPDAVWVGHPLRDALPRARRPAGPDAPVALLPGSRRGEHRRHLPLLVDAARAMMARQMVRAFVVPVSAPSLRTGVAAAFAGLPVTITHGDAAEAVARSRGALVASGTATLQTALLGCPQVVLYRLHPVTYAVARRLMIVDHWALPNILLQTPAVPERIQRSATGTALTDALQVELAKGPEPALTLAEQVRTALGPPGAADRAAASVVALAEGRRG